MRQRTQWSEKEVLRLKEAVDLYGTSWKDIILLFPNRKITTIKTKWFDISKKNYKISKTRWTEEEVDRLINAVKEYNTSWKKMLHIFPDKTANALRVKWVSLNRRKTKKNNNKAWTENEMNILLTSIDIDRNSWKDTCLLIPNRSRNKIRAKYRHLSKHLYVLKYDKRLSSEDIKILSEIFL